MNSPTRQSANTSITDQLGKSISLPSEPLRIVSLVPSQTELLYDLGLGEEVVGITKFCIHPDTWFRAKTRVGGTKKVDVEIVRFLNPNLVLANKEENLPEEIRAIEAFCPVWTSDISTVEQALDMIHQIGKMTGTIEKATDTVSQVNHAFHGLTFDKTYRCAYMIWKDPWMAAGGDTFINAMLRACGMENVLETHLRYPVLQWSELIALKPEVVLLSSEPYPFKMKDLQILYEILPEVKLRLVDGEIFSWYGSRMLMAPEYFRWLRNGLEEG